MLTIIAYPHARKYQKGKEQKDQGDGKGEGEGKEQYGHAPQSPGTVTSDIAKCGEAVRDHEPKQRKREETAGCA